MFENLKNVICSKKYKIIISNLLKYWYIVNFIFFVFIALFDFDFAQICFLMTLLMSIIFILISISFIIGLYYILKIVKTQFFRVFCIICGVTLNVFINVCVLEIIDHILTMLFFYIFIPLFFITILCIPQKFLSMKKYILTTIIFIEIFVYACICFMDYTDNKNISNSLTKHDTNIQLLEIYRVQHGYYPGGLQDIKTFNSDYYKHVEYKQLNGGQNYIYKVKESEGDFYPVYVYTPDQEYKKELLKNEQRKNSPTIYIDKGKWILEKIDD